MAAPRTALRSAVVRSVVKRPGNVRELELAVPGIELAPFGVGSHVDLHLPGEMVRSYSLIGQHQPGAHYRIAVALDANSRGGSRFIHDNLPPGSSVQLGDVRNNFPLNEEVPFSVFFAGGIGITPLLGMMARLDQLGRDWQIHYCARTRDAASFIEDLDHGSGRVKLFFDDENAGRRLDMTRIVSDAPPDSHFYCCGPRGMLELFETATADVDEERIHFEAFAPIAEAATAGGFEVELARSQVRVSVLPGQSILEAISDAGIDVPFSCREGTCGTCETAVLAGEPDHRDNVLTASERASNKTMMICCSGSKSARLVLDL